ncbi:ACP S-malonyltransferase [Saccharothrix deserti]|uniref:ACP S-malonyltransferase n=1 Tax=Saccharothrix deserti TaxID=2593674 RepID=UPI001EE459D6|nr:ACP S-malonyltransferase [Saccharothrix deserti]
MGPVRFQDVARLMVVNPFARELTGRADEVLGYSLFDRYEVEEGDYSEAAQVAFLVTCLALAQWSGQEAELCAGASFGGKAAAVYSGALGFEDAVRVTVGMARCEREYFALHHSDVVTESFARTPRERLDEILTELDWYEVSCEVDEDLYMVTLREDRLEWLQRRIRSVGGMPLYTMRPPLHASVFGPLRDVVEREVLAGIPFVDPVIPVVADQDGAVLRTGEDVRTRLLDGYVRAVRWPAVVDSLRDNGIEHLHVAGPDRLFGRVRRVRESFSSVTLVDPRTALRPRRPVPVA